MYPMKANPIQSGIGCLRNSDTTPRLPSPPPPLSIFALSATGILTLNPRGPMSLIAYPHGLTLFPSFNLTSDQPCACLHGGMCIMSQFMCCGHG